MGLNNTKLTVSLSSTQTNPLDLATGQTPLSYVKSMVLSSGTAANQADRIFHDQRTLAASATEDLDLAGVLTDSFGAAITFARIKALLITAAAGNTNVVNLTRTAVNGVPLFTAAGDGISILPSGGFAWWSPGATGVVVTPGTGDLLTVANGGAGTSVTYDVVIIGASA
jgi:hypothetical protein